MLTPEILAAMRDLDPTKKFVDDPDWTTERALTLLDERDALARFKSWVHAYLDAKGVPTHPDGPHSKEGCRIGDRMDFVSAELGRLRGVAEQYANGIESEKKVAEGLRQEIERLRGKLFDYRIDPDVCGVRVKGEPCVLKAGHEGGHLWERGD